MKATLLAAWAFSVTCGVGCAGSTVEREAPPNAETATAKDQPSVGAGLYAHHCASCHGARGEGNAKVPAIVGRSALPLDAHPPSQSRKTKFRTAGDVLQFMKTAMPPAKPGSLTDDEYAAILAFDLKANVVDLNAERVDATTAESFVLHP
jgi:mono/diheme cytochrome c family protein